MALLSKAQEDMVRRMMASPRFTISLDSATEMRTARVLLWEGFVRRDVWRWGLTDAGVRYAMTRLGIMPDPANVPKSRTERPEA